MRTIQRILRTFGLIFGVLLVLAALVAAYLLTGASSAQTRVQYNLVLPDPAAKTDTDGRKIAVTLTIQPGLSPFLDLYLREPVQDGRQRITGFTARRGDQAVLHWQTLPFFPDVIRLWNGFSTEPLTISYQVDPLWMKGPESPRSYLGPDFAYIRGMVTLYTPLSASEILQANFYSAGTDAGFAEAEIALPVGWDMVSPFGSGKIATPVANLRNAYFGFGPFDLQEITSADTPFLLGVYQGLPADRREALGKQIPMLFAAMQKMTGFSPVSRTCYWSLAIFPQEPIHGGASGTGSLVVNDEVKTIAHEMFHWWNGDTLDFTPDANWLKEGFTSYYAAKSMLAAGLWTDAEFEAEIDKSPYVLWGDGAPRPVNLLAASNQLVRQNKHDAYDPVYFGGTLLAYHLDRQLRAQGKTLDQLWLPLTDLHRPVSSQDFLHALETLAGSDLARQAADFLNGQSVEIMR